MWPEIVICFQQKRKYKTSTQVIGPRPIEETVWAHCGLWTPGSFCCYLQTIISFYILNGIEICTQYPQFCLLPTKPKVFAVWPLRKSLPILIKWLPLRSNFTERVSLSQERERERGGLPEELGSWFSVNFICSLCSPVGSLLPSTQYFKFLEEKFPWATAARHRRAGRRSAPVQPPSSLAPALLTSFYQDFTLVSRFKPCSQKLSSYS